MEEYWNKFLTELNAVIGHGGLVLWCMLGLAALLYGSLASTWFGLIKVKREIKSLDRTMALDQELSEVVTDVSIFELDRLAWVERRLPVISVMIALAPLAGLLGTVSGMLSTFDGMATRSSSKPIDSISSGISEALVTTQAGLFMAIPAALIFALLKSRVAQVHGELEQHECAKIAAMKGALV